MTNKYAQAINTLWLHARWWITFLHITWIVGGFIDFGSDFALGGLYAKDGKESWAYYTIGFALVAGILNVFVVLFGVRRVPKLSTGVTKYIILFFTVCLCGPLALYFVMMIDLNKDFIDDDSAEIISRTLWIAAIVELVFEQMPQALLQNFILANDDSVSAAQLFAILTSTIGAACTFAGFVDLLARDRKGFFHLLTGRGLDTTEKEVRKIQVNNEKKKSPAATLRKLDRIGTHKPNNSPGYNSLVFLGLLIFVYMLPVALLSAQFNISLIFMLLINAFPVLFMVAAKLFGMKYKPWIYTSLALAFASVVVVITIWYGKVAEGWLGGISLNGTNVTGTTEIQPDGRQGTMGVTQTIGHLAKTWTNLWSGELTSITSAADVFFGFIICFSAFCFVLGVLTSEFTPFPCCRKDAVEAAVEEELESMTEKETVDGETKDRGEKSVEETLREFRSELTSLRDRMNDVEKQMEQRQNVIGGNGAIAT